MKINLLEQSYVNIVSSIEQNLNIYDTFKNYQFSTNKSAKNHWIKINSVNKKILILDDIFFNYQGTCDSFTIFVTVDNINFNPIFSGSSLPQPDEQSWDNVRFRSILIVFYNVDCSTQDFTVLSLSVNCEYDVSEHQRQFMSFAKYNFIPPTILEKYPLVDEFVDKFCEMLETNTKHNYNCFSDKFDIKYDIEIVDDFDYSVNSTTLRGYIFNWDSNQDNIPVKQFYQNYLDNNFSSLPLSHINDDCETHFDGITQYQTDYKLWYLYNNDSQQSDWDSIPIDATDNVYYAPQFQYIPKGYTFSAFIFNNDLTVDQQLIGNINGNDSGVIIQIKSNQLVISIKDAKTNSEIDLLTIDNFQQGKWNHLIFSYQPQYHDNIQYTVIRAVCNLKVFEQQQVNYRWNVSDRNNFLTNFQFGETWDGGISHIQIFKEAFDNDRLWKFAYNVFEEEN